MHPEICYQPTVISNTEVRLLACHPATSFPHEFEGIARMFDACAMLFQFEPSAILIDFWFCYINLNFSYISSFLISMFLSTTIMLNFCLLFFMTV